MLMFSTTDQQQRNDENILATIEGELTDDQAMSELATVISERPTFDESRADDDDPVTSQNERIMLTPDDGRSEVVVPGTDNIGQFDDESVGFSDVCVSPATLSYQTRSDTVKSQEEETSNGDTVDRRNSTDCDVDSVSAVDCVVSNASHNECDPSVLANDVSKTACSVIENYNHAETESDTRSPREGTLETSGVSSAEMTSSVSVIDTYAVVDSSDVISDVDSTLIVSLPDTETAGNVPASCSTDAVLAENAHQTDVLSSEAVRLEPTEAIDTEAKKGFRVRFPKDHVTGYLDPPTPWREGWHQFCFSACALQWRIITCC